jgi:hypothetical protein
MKIVDILFIYPYTIADGYARQTFQTGRGYDAKMRIPHTQEAVVKQKSPVL